MYDSYKAFETFNNCELQLKNAHIRHGLCEIIRKFAARGARTGPHSPTTIPKPMQKTFKNVQELLWRLYTERQLLSEMFIGRKKMEFRYEDACREVKSEDDLQLLIDYGVIRQEGELLELEETYLQFLETVLQVNEEISNASVAESIDALKQYIDFYLKEQGNPEGQRTYLRRVKRQLRNIAQMAERNVVDLKRNINDTYKHERNYAIKRAKLEKYQEQIGYISSLVNATEQLLDDEHATFSRFAPDEQLMGIITDVRTQLKEAFHHLIDLQRTIRDYLHLIEQQNRLVKKIRQLKYLKDQLTWTSSQTNVREVMEQINPLCFEPQPYYQIKPSLELLANSAEGLEALNEARRGITQKVKHRHTATPPVTPHAMQPAPVVEDFVDTDALATAFLASGQDLFRFVMNYHYATPQSEEQRVELYTEIIQNHFAHWRFTEEWSKMGRPRYPIIYPAKL